MPYPNPASSILSIPVQASNGPFRVAIFSVDGRLVDQIDLGYAGPSGQLELNIEQLARGTYIMSISSGDTRVCRRFTRL
jgi:hypothetical protein